MGQTPIFFEDVPEGFVDFLVFGGQRLGRIWARSAFDPDQFPGGTLLNTAALRKILYLQGIIIQLVPGKTGRQDGQSGHHAQKVPVFVSHGRCRHLGSLLRLVSRGVVFKVSEKGTEFKRTITRRAV